MNHEPMPAQGPVDANVSRQSEIGENECQVKQWNGRCCCTCRYHLRDNHHCTTAHELREQKGGCVCNEPKGWICVPPEFEGTAHSGWAEHGLCEMHDFKPANRGNKWKVFHLLPY